MRLVRIARVFWEVTAILDGRGRSVWAALLDEGNDRYADRMRKRLKQRVPRAGPRSSRIHGTMLRDGIGEFSEGPRRGKKLRVLYFFDEGHRIICTHHFWKDTPSTPNSEINKALKKKRKYFQAKKAGSVKVLLLQDVQERGSER